MTPTQIKELGLTTEFYLLYLFDALFLLFLVVDFREGGFEAGPNLQFLEGVVEIHFAFETQYFFGEKKEESFKLGVGVAAVVDGEGSELGVFELWEGDEDEADDLGAFCV
jgi:hypothetical protein